MSDIIVEFSLYNYPPILYSFFRRYSSKRIHYTLTLHNNEVMRGAMMIDYSPFWDKLEKSNENWYTLTNKYHISNSTLHRLKHNMDVSTKTLNDLCRILSCDICDIIRYIPSEKDQTL